jgi:sugar O-acyltransferase (sialic acid O-acetyltransferase NeuD family)
MAERLVVIGSGGHAKVVVEAAIASHPGRGIAILDDDEANRDRSVLGIPVSGSRGELDSLRGMPVIVAVGSNQARGELIDWVRQQGHSLESVIHPRAFVADSVKLGAGVFVSAGAIVIAEAVVGVGAIINTGGTVDHDCDIGEAAHIGPGAHLCGNVRVGARALIGVGASIRPGISICDDAVIGAGSVVVGDIDEAGTYVGNPARRLR